MGESVGEARSLSDEQIINRWSFDYYVFKALSAFRDADYTAFTHFTSIVESLVVRPVDGHSDMIVKLRCMQFLSRINNGDKLDLTFEEPKTPLESALSVLEDICRDMSVPPREKERVQQAIIETLMVVCLRSGEFTRAEEVLLTHFSDAADSAGKRKLFESLVRRRRSSHSVLQLSSYSDFKQDMLDFIERLYRVPEPFLLQMLRRSGHPGVSSEPVTSSSQERQKDHGGAVRLSLRGLRQVYGVLSERYGVSVSFSQLQQELEHQDEQEQSPELHLALSETPRDPESQPPYAGMTISRLVQEDDSQLSDQGQDTRSPHRILVTSGPESDEPELQTPVTRSHSRSSSTSPHDRSPARHTQKHIRMVLSSDVELEDHAASPPSRCSSRQQQKKKKKSDHSESALVSSPARPRRSDRDTQNQSQSSESECVVELEVKDGGSCIQHSTPARPSSTDTQRHRNRSVTVSSESEEHSESPAVKTSRRSSPSPGGAHKRRRARWQDVSGTHENWSDEESLFSSTSGRSSKKSSRKMWTVQESEWLKEGVRRFGAGHWEKIRSSFPFTERTAVNLKDRWRTMLKLRLV
ncbi:telomeric repeat binding factor a isoform X3 [Carassius auratus]|uniref:Telomeric repeat binding factor a isoform X3 n=1 Tax=Carassius auratus TaxID=7957 RepID=A0A6P6MC33_CARAU|nr:telomeric repeat-binding factor 2 isoform X3 [Carassius auratus]